MNKVVDSVRRDDMRQAIVCRRWAERGREIIFIRWNDGVLASSVTEEVIGLEGDSGSRATVGLLVGAASTLRAVCIGAGKVRVGEVVGVLLGWISTLGGGTLGGGARSGGSGDIFCLVALLNILARLLMAFKWVGDKVLKGATGVGLCRAAIRSLAAAVAASADEKCGIWTY
eukprot:1376080-Ditylum_brightwellii.AAC.1